MSNSSSQDKKSCETQDFYDEFSSSRMLNYRLYYGNPRIDKAVDLIVQHIKPNSNILDIGCGIGIVPERVSSKLSDGYIWACDLSEKNIEYAEKTVNSSRIKFFSVDVLKDFSSLVEKITTPVDIVTMVDVIEHLPLSEHEGFFHSINSVMADDALLIMTYPSPGYQRYLIKDEPQELQVIDEVVEIEHLIKVASFAGLKLQSFSYSKTETKYKYIHVVFSRNLEYDPTDRIEKTFYEKIKKKLFYSYRKLLFPYLKYKYKKD